MPSERLVAREEGLDGEGIGESYPSTTLALGLLDCSDPDVLGTSLDFEVGALDEVDPELAIFYQELLEVCG